MLIQYAIVIDTERNMGAMTGGKMEMAKNGFWEERYLEMERAVGGSVEEREILSKLRLGYTPLQCMRECNLSQKEFSDLLAQAKKWEIENMCVTLTPEEKQRLGPAGYPDE